MKSVLILLQIMLLSTISFSQEITISGTIKDKKGEPVPFASVKVKGANEGAETDISGIYKLTTTDAPDLTLVIFSPVHEKKEILVAGRTSIDAVLEGIKEFEEIVVVGYGESTSKELTGATSKVSGEDVEKMNLSRMDQALQGQVSGVNISTNSGSPGGSSNIRIRGLSTFGNNNPLILVDGVVYDAAGLNALNPSDIESINVLKDATAGIYGVRAANGVIIVTTKKGKLNAKPSVEYNAYFGIQQTAKKLNLLNAQEYAVIKNEMFGNGGEQLPFNNTNLGTGTNWQDSIFQNAPVQSHNFSISGGSQNTRYSIGLGYFTQDGIVGGEKATFSRYNARLNFSTDMSEKLKINSIFLFSNDVRSGLPENGLGSVLYNTVNAFPTSPIITPDGNFSYLDEVSDIINPVAQIQNQFNSSVADKFVGKEEFVYNFNDHFSFTNSFGYNYALVDSKVFSPLVWYGPGKYANTAANEDLESPLVEIAEDVFIERGASIYEERASFLDLTYESYLNYNKTFKSIHNVKGTLGATVFQRKGESLSGVAYGIPNNSLEFADVSASTADGGFLNNTFSYEFKERLVSAFIRAEYRYASKYMVSGILRRDGSSKFGPNNRFGIFPTISGAWIVNEEDFFDVKMIDFFKIRASFGVSGNDQIPNFAYRALLDGEGVYVFNDIITQGVAIGRTGNPDLKWETTRQLNIGADLTLWKRLDFTTNYFVKNTFDLLFQPDVSAVLGSYGPGGFPPIINAGDVSNRGIEIELGFSTNPDKDLVVGANYNFTAITNKVTSVPDGIDFLPGANFGVGAGVATRFEEGFEIGYFHGYETAGIFQTQEEIDNHPVQQANAQPGDLIFVDKNGDGIINFSDDSDKTDLGSPIPDFIMGLSLNAKYKSFDVSANIYAALGQEIIRNYERNQPYANQLDYVINRWTGPGSTNIHPRVTSGPTNNTIFSSYYVEDGSFVRLRNIQVGYTFPSNMMKKIKVQSLRIYFAVNNLVTYTSYLGFDPDVGSGGVLSAGVDYGIYPQARTFMGGIQLKF